MRIHTLPALALAGVLAPLALAACGLDVSDLNDPSLDDLKNHPDAISINAACIGLLIGNRGNQAAENGYVSLLGILGREAYNFDAADPRYITEMLQGTLDAGSPYGGNFWAIPYANLQLGTVILGALDKVSDLSDSDKAAIRGFTRTINALDLLDVVNTHASNGAVLDINPDPLGQLSPIVTDTTMQLDKITGLLDDALPDLMTAKTGGDTFPFLFGKGFANFDTPTTFLTFNHAIRARVAAYAGDYSRVLSELALSFRDDNPMTIDINNGVYYAYSTKPGDTSNALINPNIFVHPKISADAEHNANNDPIDDRLLRKTAAVDSPGGARIAVDLPHHPDAMNTPLPILAFKKLYPSPESSVPLIRNEELVLLEAEAKWFTSDHAGAITALNLIREVSGKLGDLSTPPTTNAQFVAALLHEREFSLLFEGHRWIDVRRFNPVYGTLGDLPLYLNPATQTKPAKNDALNVRFPIPLSECNARTNEPACALGST